MSICSWCGSHNHTRSQCDEDPLPLFGYVPAPSAEADDETSESKDDE